MSPRQTDRILGWDVGGTKSAAVLATAAGRIVARRQWPSRTDRGPEAMIREFLEQAAALRKTAGRIRGLGVSIGGPLDTRTGTIHSPPHLPGWDNLPLADRLRGELHLAVAVEHDAAACLLAEWLSGAARGASHCAYLTCGTGCGAGMMIGGRIVRGPAGQTPELGHVRLAADGPVMFGKAGCVESFCSGEGIGRLAGFMFPERFPTPVTAAELNRLTGGGDAAASAVLAEAARRTGQAAAILADLFCPQVIVLGALGRRFGAGWLKLVRGQFAREALPINARQTRIVLSRLGGRLQDLSPIAAWLARQDPPADAGQRA